MSELKVGELTYGSGHYADAPDGYDGGPAVLMRVSDNPKQPARYHYKVVLPVRETWQAQAIVAILSAEKS